MLRSVNDSRLPDTDVVVCMPDGSFVDFATGKPLSAPMVFNEDAEIIWSCKSAVSSLKYSLETREKMAALSKAPSRF